MNENQLFTEIRRDQKAPEGREVWIDLSEIGDPANSEGRRGAG